MNEHTLKGIDGANPLGFLAALGVLRGLTRARADRDAQIGWTLSGGGWRPLLGTWLSAEEVCDALLEECGRTAEHATLNLADNLTIDGRSFREHLIEQLKHRGDYATEFASAFGCDALCDDKGNIVDTALRTMAGAGHQHFLKTMREVLRAVTVEHLSKTLYQTWRYDDALQGLSLRFDPMDERRYAHQWGDPSGDPTRSKRGSMLGANALAVLGIPLLKVVPVSGDLETTGFRGRRASDCYWTWPIWESPASIDVVASILSLRQLQEIPKRGEGLERGRQVRDALSRMGIVAVYRAQRITVGKFRNFATAVAV